MVASLTLLLLAATPRPSAFVPKNRPYDVQHYRIDLRLHDDGSFDNTVTIRLKPRQALGAVELDSFGLSIKSAKVDAAAATFALKEDPAARSGTLTVKPAHPLSPGKESTLEIAYAGKAVAGHEGFFTIRDSDAPDSLPYYFTQFESSYARRFFPCNDEPADKATTEVFAVVDGRYQVFSNGHKLLDEAFTEKEEHLRRVHWLQDKPHSTYLVALAIGQFKDTEVGGDIPATIHMPPPLADLAFIASDATRSALEMESQFLGVKYPWDKYDQVGVPHFYWGGMENTSLTLERADDVAVAARNDVYGRPERVGLVSHELAHQWFGDLVTLKWWDDTWLNEGFATYLGGKAMGAYFDNDIAAVETAAHTFVDYFREEDGPRAHPLVASGAPSPDDVFDRTSYVKGAAILRMLETWVGTDDFRKALGAYLNQYALGNATSDDFFSAVGKSTHKERELKPFKDSWLRKKGYPIITPTLDWSGSTLTLTIKQRPNHDDEKGPFVFKLPIVIHRNIEPAYTRELTVLMDKPVVTAKLTDLPAEPQWVNWDKDGAALVRIESSVISEQKWIDGARKDPDPVWRLLSLYVLLGPMVDPSAKTLVKPTESAMDALTNALTTDASPYVRQAVLDRIGMSRWNRLSPELGPVILELAKSPSGLPEDPVGVVWVKHAALAALGKIDFPDGQRYLLDGLAQPDVDINYLGGYALGAGRMGDIPGLAATRAAVNVQKARGWPYFQAALGGLAATSTPELVPVLAETLHANAGDDETARTLISGLEDNFRVKDAPEFAAFVRYFILQSKDFGDDVKARLLQLLDDVRTPEVHDALTAIEAKTESDRIKGKVQQMLAHNFPAPPKGKKG
jgi:hypothetical protein